MKTEHYFDERSTEWSELYAKDVRFERRLSRISKLLDTVLPKPPGLALDMGCGSGVFTRLLSTKGWKVVGVDASSEMIEQARRASTEGIEYHTSTVDAFHTEERFDAIVSFSMLEYVERDDEALTKLTNLLAPRGVIVLSVPNRVSLLRKIERVIFGIRMVTRDRLFRGRGEYLKYQKQQYAPLELDLMMRERGFRKVRAIYLNSGLEGPLWLVKALEQRSWAAMYCAAYVRR